MDKPLARARLIHAKAERKREAKERETFCIQNGVCPKCGEDLENHWKVWKRPWWNPWGRYQWVTVTSHGDATALHPWYEVRCINDHSFTYWLDR